MKHRRLKPIIVRVCSNDNTRLTLTYFTAGLNFAIKAFIWEDATMMDCFEIIAACDFVVG